MFSFGILIFRAADGDSDTTELVEVEGTGHAVKINARSILKQSRPSSQWWKEVRTPEHLFRVSLCERQLQQSWQIIETNREAYDAT